MMLTAKERAEIALLVRQAPRDVEYMLSRADDPDSTLTRGMAERHQGMAKWLGVLLEHVARAGV